MKDKLENLDQGLQKPASAMYTASPAYTEVL